MNVFTLISLLTVSTYLNATTFNQGNNCIVAINGDTSRPPEVQGNQTLGYSVEQCQARFENALKQVFAQRAQQSTGLIAQSFMG
jgi:hypothetical protein